jgi:predicted TIM-barrel fold metal-dependent hydrolase
MSMMRLVLSGIFDTYPGLKIILGHLGEALPFLLARMDYPYVIPWFDRATIPHLEKKPSDYFRNNVFLSPPAEIITSQPLCAHMRRWVWSGFC